MEEVVGGEPYGYTAASEDAREHVLRRYLGILRRRIWVVLAAFVIVVVWGTMNAYKAVPIYEAVAKIVVETTASNPVKSEVEYTGAVSWWRDERHYQAQKELIKTRAVLEKALKRPEVQDVVCVAPPKVGEIHAWEAFWNKVKSEIHRTVSAVLGIRSVPVRTRLPEPWEQLQGQLIVDLSAPFLLVKVDDTDPVRAAKLANAVASAFEEFHTERKRRVSHEAFMFLQEQRAKQEEELAKAETALQKFREDSEAVSLDSESSDHPVMARYKALCTELTKTQIERVSLQAQVLVIKEAINSGADALTSGNSTLFSIPAVRDDKQVNQFMSQVIEAEKEIATLSNTLGPQSPQLQGAQIKLDMARRKLQEALSQLIESLSSQLQILTKQEQALQKEYEEQTSLALGLAKQSLKWDHLKNEVERQRKLYDVLLDRLRDVNISSDYAKASVEVVEPAVVPTAPIRPNRVRLVWMAVFMGLLAGVGLALFCEYLDDTIKTPDDMVSRVGVPVLGFVPDIGTRNGRSDSFAYRGRIALMEPKSSVTEAYRTVRTSLFFSAPPEESKVLVVTSSGPRDGKTTTASNLSVVIAQSGKRVLLVDADFRRPCLHKIFELDSKVGFSNVLVRQCKLEDAVKHVKHNGKVVENLDVLVAGPKPPNPAELLDSQAMRQFLDEVRKKYDRVIIDTTPILFVADASIVSGMSDAVIMVVKSAKHSRSLAIKARQQLESVKARIIGGVLNDVHVSRFGYYYSYYYHYYPYSRYYRDYYRTYYPSEKGAEEEQTNQEPTKQETQS